MKTFGIFSIFLTILSAVNASESYDFNILIEEKAKIRAELEIVSKPSPGQLIFAVTSTVPKVPFASPTTSNAIEAVAETKPTPTTESKPRKSKKDEREKEEESDEEDKSTVSKKTKDTRKSVKKNKKSSNDTETEDNDADDDELPKRLFRPRFRAENSADTLKAFTYPALLITLSVSLMTGFFI